MYPGLTVKKLFVLFIGILCVTGCGNTSDRKADSKPPGIKKTDMKDAAGKQSGRYDEVGIASFISDEYDGKMTASGVRYDRNKLTAAHPSLPFGTRILITNLGNTKKVEVTVIDRFQRTTDRVVNVSHKAGLDLDLIESGIAKVGIIIVEKPVQDFN